MKLFTSVRLAATALCVVSGVLATSGCGAVHDIVVGGKFEFHCPQQPPAGLSIAVGARANSPAPAPPAEVRKMIVDAMAGCGKITVVRVDGRPAIAGTEVFSSAAKNRQNFDIDQRDFLMRVDKLLTASRALTAEANVLGALGVAAGAAGAGGTVVLVDSGVQTTDPIDLRKNNLPAKKPKVIAEALQREGLLPALADRKVIMSGLGYTAPPQSPLDERNRAFLLELWREIALAAGAKDPVLIPEPNTSQAVVSNPPVGVVTFPANAIILECDALSVLPDNGEVGFIPDQAEFRNAEAARGVLRTFAGFLTANPGARVEIQGFVAHYGNGDLSQRRADRVKNELVSLGVRNAITAKGMGWGPYPNPTASPDPRYDQSNRQVTISITCN
jgi:outer membrane protein OmpA-like peptidoglycan-associated protein